jgi:actin-related protein 4
LVLDPGTETTRAGFAGEDLPKRVIASQYGYIPPKEEGKEGQYFLDDINVLRRRGGMEVKWPIQDGIGGF